MKTPTSAFLCALLAASLTPCAGHAAVASMNTPLAAQKAFQSALRGLDASGWPAAAEAASVSQPVPTIVPQTAPPKADAVMTEELMARLIKYTKAVTISSSVDKDTCRIFDLCDGTASLPLQSAEADTPTDGGVHNFSIPLKFPNDILFLRMTPGKLESFLTDKTGKLRAAAVKSNGVARLITNEKAAEQYQKELALFAREAADLPPTGAVVAGK